MESFKKPLFFALNDGKLDGTIHKWDSDFLGYDNKVNEFIDFPVRWLGPRHRILFHTLEEAMFIGFMIDGWRGVMGEISHLMLDGVLTEQNIRDINYGIRKYCEVQLMVYMAEAKIKRNKKQLQREEEERKAQEEQERKKKPTYKVLGVVPAIEKKRAYGVIEGYPVKGKKRDHKS